MGMFDTVSVPCPKCGTMVEKQSKAHNCSLSEYTLRDAPLDIANDLDGEKTYCRNDDCGHVWTLKASDFTAVKEIGMSVSEKVSAICEDYEQNGCYDPGRYMDKIRDVLGRRN